MNPNENIQTHPLIIPAAIVVAGILVAGAIYFGGQMPNKGGSAAIQANTKVVPAKSEDHIIGSRNADVVIIEYSDTECPFCKVFHYTMKDVVSAYGGKVAWIYRHLPIEQLHANAMKEAEATECAAELGGNQAFWNYLDKIFETTNSNDSLKPTELPKLAVAIGLNEVDFNTCLASGKYTEAVKKSVQEGYDAGARGTPFSLIMVKGEQKNSINGAEPLASVKLKIDALLK